MNRSRIDGDDAAQELCRLHVLAGSKQLAGHALTRSAISDPSPRYPTGGGSEAGLLGQARSRQTARPGGAGDIADDGDSDCDQAGPAEASDAQRDS